MFFKTCFLTFVRDKKGVLNNNKRNFSKKLFLASMVVLVPSYSFCEGTDGASTNTNILADQVVEE